MADEPDSPAEEPAERAPKFRVWAYTDGDALAGGRQTGSRLELVLIGAIVLAVWINAGFIIVREFF